MSPSDRSRFLLASLTAPLPAVLVVVAVCVAGLGFPELSEDDAPVRAAGAVLMLSPLFYLVTVALLFGITKALAALRILSRRNLLGLAAAGSLAFGAWPALKRPFGKHDALVSLVVFGVTVFVLLASAVFAWWWVARVSPAGPQRHAGVRGLL